MTTMRKTVTLAVWIWCGVCLGGITRAEVPMFGCDQVGCSTPAHVGLLSTETHAQLLALLGEPVLRVIRDGDAAAIAGEAKTYDLSAIDPAAAAAASTPQQVPEPGTFALLAAGGAAVLAVRRRTGRKPLTR